MSITKIVVANHHVNTAIEMIAYEMSVISTHVVVMAAEEIIRSISIKTSIKIPLDVDNFIIDEKRDWFRKLRRANYNWFKHADRDFDSALQNASFRQINLENELQTMSNMHSLATLERRGFKSIEGMYLAYMLVFHKDLFNLDKLFEILPDLQKTYESYVTVDRENFLATFRQVLERAGKEADYTRL